MWTDSDRETTTVTAALRTTGLCALSLIDGATIRDPARAPGFGSSTAPLWQGCHKTREDQAL